MYSTRSVGLIILSLISMVVVVLNLLKELLQVRKNRLFNQNCDVNRVE